MKKRFLAIMMVTVMAVSMFAGCNKKTTDTGSKTATLKDGDKFYIYSWNTEVKDRILKLYTDKYGEEKAKKLEFVNLGGTDTYQDKLDPLLMSNTNEAYPDMFAMEADYIVKYTDNEITRDISELGITEKDYSNMYGYTLEAAKSSDGKVKGLSWQACPGGIAYRRSLAQEYLGVSEPEQVQEFFKDWATVKKTAETIKSKSAGKTRLFAGYTELQRPYQATRKSAWVKDQSLAVDDSMVEYMKESKAYCDAGYASAAADDQQWKTNWSASCGDNSVFAYTSCTWFTQWSLMEYVEKNHKETIGDWGMIQGPTQFSWGGTWLAATRDCADTTIAKEIMLLLCDTDSMKTVYNEFYDYPNNKEAVAALAEEEKNAKEPSKVVKLLGGQSPLAFFQPIAENITLPELCIEDFYANKYFNEEIATYASGEKSYDDAIANFDTRMKSLYQYLDKK